MVNKPDKGFRYILIPDAASPYTESPVEMPMIDTAIAAQTASGSFRCRILPNGWSQRYEVG